MLERLHLKARVFERVLALLPDDDGQRGSRLFILSGTVFVVGFLLWSSLAHLDIIARAMGEVIPSTMVKSVQHLEGGIVSEILVREGDRVKVNQPLVALQSTANDSQVDEIRVRVNSLRLDILRLQAEAAGAQDLVLPAEIIKAQPAEAAQARALFKARREKYHSSLASQQQAIAQREQALNEINARQRNTRNSLKLIEEQVKISEDLLRDDLTNRYNHLALLRDQSSLRSRIEEDTASIRRAELAIAEAQAQIETIRRAYDQEVKEQATSAQRELDEFTQRLKRVADSQNRTVLRSPVDGVVKTLKVVTTGGVIKAGDTVLDIVPGGDRLIVEARLPVYEVGHIQTGQTARIRLSSNEGARFGTIDGTVVHISPDTLTAERGGSYYKVRIETASDQFQSAGQIYRLYPGVQVEADIITGSRSVLQYVLDPFVGYAGRAMQER